MTTDAEKLAERLLSRCDCSNSFGGHSPSCIAYYRPAVAAALAEARNAALEEAAKEVCIYCRRNGAPDFVDGDYKWAGHRGKNGHGVYDCRSIAIRALREPPK